MRWKCANFVPQTKECGEVWCGSSLLLVAAKLESSSLQRKLASKGVIIIRRRNQRSSSAYFYFWLWKENTQTLTAAQRGGWPWPSNGKTRVVDAACLKEARWTLHDESAESLYESLCPLPMRSCNAVTGQS